MGYINFEVEGADDIRLVKLALTEQLRSIPREIDKTFTHEARILRDRARAKIKAQPTPKKAGHTGLRREIAAGVHYVRINPKPEWTGIRISTMMPERDEAMLPRGTDSPIKGWRHPVFGNRNNWVRQHGAYSWFIDTMQDAEEDMRVRLQWVFEDAAEDIDAVT